MTPNIFGVGVVIVVFNKVTGQKVKGETEVNKIKVYILNSSKGDVIGWYKVFLSKLQQIWWRDHQEVINAVIGHGLFFVF